MKLLTKLKDLPKENWILFFVTLINRAGSMALFFLILYLHDRLNVSVRVGGLIVGLYGLGALFAGLIGGLLTDSIGAFWVMFLSFVLSGTLMLIYPLAHNLYIIMLLTFMLGLLGECYRPANQVAINHFCSLEQSKAAYALNRLGINLGMSIAPVIGGLLANSNFAMVFIIDGFTTLGAAIFLYRKLHHYFIFSHLKQKGSISVLSSVKIVFADSKMFYPMVAYVLILLVFFQLNSTLPIFMTNNLHALASTFGFMCSINTILIILFEVPINVYTSNWPHRMTLSLGAFLIAVGYGYYMQIETILGIAVGVVLWTIGEMIIFPAMAAYVMEIAPIDKRGIYMGVYSMGISLALISGPILGTQLLESASAPMFWFICLIVGLISTIMFLNIKNSK